MLPKERRIERKHFSYILSKGIRFNSPRFLLYVAKMVENTANNKTKIAFSISKKISPKAAHRNKYRRRGYSSLGSYLNNLRPGYFLFFSYKKGSIPASFDDIQKEVVRLLSESSVLE